MLPDEALSIDLGSILHILIHLTFQRSSVVSDSGQVLHPLRQHLPPHGHVDLAKDGLSRNRIIDIVMDWFQDPTSNTDPEAIRFHCELNFASLHTVIMLLERLKLQPIDNDPNDGDDSGHSGSIYFRRPIFAEASHREADIRNLVITGLSHLVTSNSENAVKHYIASAYDSDMKKRTIFVNIFARVLRQRPTPPHKSAWFAEAGLKSTPHAVGSAVVSANTNSTADAATEIGTTDFSYGTSFRRTYKKSFLHLKLSAVLFFFLFITPPSCSLLFTLHLVLTLPTSAMLESSPEPDNQTCREGGSGLILPDLSGAVPTSTEARAKRRIAALEEELQTMRQERGTKKRKTTYYVAQGRAIRRMIVLYTNLEDLIAENDRRYEECTIDDPADGSTLEQDRMQRGYIELSQSLPWFHIKLADLDIDDSEDMLKELKRGADAARGDDTSTLKDLIATWVNQDFHPSPLLRSDDKQLRGFVHDVCGKLLCPSEWDWNNNVVKAGIRDRTSNYIVNLEKGLFMSKIMIQAFKAIFTSPSSVREADGDVKVKTCVASNYQHEESYTSALSLMFACQVRFALSGVSSWRTVDGDFDYEGFWNNVVDFFENVPGPVARRRVATLLEWWTRKIFGRNHSQDLTPEVVSQMSVTVLAEQRRALEDAAFDSE
ncbi:hypothetical protein EDD22DRAFT_1017901 [Suillus occidentalis]|nr:hypothetical protein EDD22DRAFT_1017901 [Suillus occidentalis]